MTYKVVISNSAAKSLKALPKKTQARIVGVIDSLADNPFPPAAKKLKGREGYRIRTNDYRIIYTIEKQILVITVLVIGHRKDVYKI